MAQVMANRIALEAAARSLLVAPRTNSLVYRLSNNDPTLTYLKLVRKPATHFGDEELSGFLLALEKNKTVTSVQLSWRFLSALSATERVLLMGALGALLSLEKFMMEAIGPCNALVAALQNTQNLKVLWINSLRLSSNAEVTQLAAALSRNVSLQQITLNNIRLQVQGTYRVDEQGMVWFQKNQADQKKLNKLDLNPLLMSIAEIPGMQKIQLDLKLDAATMERIAKPTLQRMCRSSGLTFLMLRCCDLDDDDVAVLAEEFQKIGSTGNVEVLNLTRNNRISEFGWKILVAMLETNYSLTGMYTPTTTGPSQPEEQYNHVLAGRFGSYVASRNAALMEPSECTPPSPETRGKMDLLLKLNEKGRKGLLTNPSKVAWLDFMIREIDDLDMVFYALLCSPGLFFV
ncbi:expressed unknown protein [Seminavis robusta]|uniref:Uncharacterized protein n=1 Tax=Seminavis robusta TaxID=568900 RepID=A0A9N8HUD9_9STRA|nr:expressed unknown protein [Seminavis robusta]|eukprot:Sro1642_g288030.1 n/a (403) ;mRNA; r:10547-11755